MPIRPRIISQALGAILLPGGFVACSSLAGGDTYRITADFTGLKSSDVLPLWGSMQHNGALECLGDDTLRTAEFVIENMPDDVMPNFARQSSASCDQLERDALSD